MTTWENLAGEDVKVEYFRDKFEKGPRRGLPLVRFVDPGVDEDEEEDDKAGAVESCGSEGGWGSWILGK